MKGSWGFLSLLVLLLSAAWIQSGFGFDLPSISTSTVPAFLWSNYHHQALYSGMKDSVDYRTISQKDLANVIVSQGGWSSLLCPETKAQQPVDIGLVFVGRELQSSHIFRNEHVDQALTHTLKVSFSRANFSVAFPYVSSSEENESMEGSLISGFTESCGQALGLSNVAYLESCSVDGEKFQKLADMHSVHDYLASAMKNKQNGQKDLIVICSGEAEDHSWSEGEILSELISSVEKSGRSYSVLFASDPNRSVQLPYRALDRALDRFLAEGTAGNASLNSSVFCDGVCQIKSSLLEGLLVAIVLIIILISGLCCMMGIDTPTRFEALQDS